MTVPAALQAHYESGITCMAAALLIQRADGQLYGITSCSRPLTLDITPWDELPWVLTGQTAFVFSSTQGLDLKQLQFTSGFEVGNSEIVTLNDGSLFDPQDMKAGRWRNALWRVFYYRWDVETPTIANDVEVISGGWLGEAVMGTNTLRIELRDWRQKLQQPVGEVSTPTCRLRVFSQGLGQCNVDPAPWTHNLTVTAAASKRQFTASAATQDDDYFGFGTITWLTGPSAGLSYQVKAFEGGVFVLTQPTIFPISNGDTFTAQAGCRGRRDEDCFTKFNNVANMRAEPDRPLVDQLSGGA